jgi:hypothetical protein
MDPRRGDLLPEDARRARQRPGVASWVLEEAGATLRMWYAGSDGTTSRILTAERPPGGGLSLWFIGGPCEISLALANSPASETR